MSRRVRASSALFALWLLLITALPVGASEPSPDFVRPEVTPPPLENATTYVVDGTPIRGGCDFPATQIELAPDESVWEVRTIGIDFESCQKLVEEGMPTILADETKFDELVVENDDERAPTSPIGASTDVVAAATRRSTGHLKVWFTDVIGLEVTSDTSYVTWYWSGSGCVTGSGSARFAHAPTGWFLWSWGNWGYNPCSYYRTHSQSKFGNNTFCGPGIWPTVWNDYYYVQVFGHNTGAMTGSHDANTTVSCLPLFENARLYRTS